MLSGMTSRSTSLNVMRKINFAEANKQNFRPKIILYWAR